jgi:ketopantoate reductase
MRVLLMSFSSEDEYRTQLQTIREIYRPDSNIFVIQNRYDDNEIFITFNTEYNFKTPGIIKIHKKRETNTLFSVDAVNHLSIQENGKIDKEWSPNWEEFNNCLLLMRDGDLAVIPTKVREIIKL